MGTSFACIFRHFSKTHVRDFELTLHSSLGITAPVLRFFLASAQVEFVTDSRFLSAAALPLAIFRLRRRRVLRARAIYPPLSTN